MVEQKADKAIRAMEREQAKLSGIFFGVRIVYKQRIEKGGWK